MHARLMLQVREWRVIGSQNLGWKIFSRRAGLAHNDAGNQIGGAQGKGAPGHETVWHFLFTRGQSGIHDDETEKTFGMLCSYGQPDQPAPILTNQGDLP